MQLICFLYISLHRFYSLLISYHKCFLFLIFQIFLRQGHSIPNTVRAAS